MYGPGIEKNDLYIEDNEEQGKEIIAEVESNPGLPHRLHAALIGGVFCRVGLSGDNAQEPEGDGKKNSCGSKTDSS